MLAGLAGGAASQSVGVATGIQSKFDFKGLALAGISGGVNAGLGGLVKIGGSQFLGDVARGALGSAVTQGIGVATGLQSNFSWTGVATAGIGAGMGGEVGRKLNLKGLAAAGGRSLGNIAGHALAGTAGAMAAAATRSALNGSSFGDNLMRELPSAIGNTIGNMTARAVAGLGGSGETSMARLRREGGVEYAQVSDPDVRSDSVEPDIIVTARRLGEEVVEQGRGFLDWIDGWAGTNLGGDNPRAKREARERSNSAYTANLIFRANSGPSYARGDPGAYFFAPDHPTTGAFTVQSRITLLHASDTVGGFVNGNFGAGSTFDRLASPIGSGLDFLYRNTLGPGTPYDTAIVKPFYSGLDLIAQTPLGDPGVIMTLESNGVTASIGALGAGVRNLVSLRTAINLGETVIPEGVVYSRIDLTGKVLPYGGQALSYDRYLGRQIEQARNYPNADFDFTIVNRAVPGVSLDIAEYQYIQQLTGGVRASKSPLVSNAKDPVGAARRPALGLPEPRGY